MRVDRQVDILIIGGGLTGSALMLSLTNMGYKILLIEGKPLKSRAHADFDARSLALAPSSVNILQTLNIWQHLQQDASAIETIHVSERQNFGSLRIKGEENSPLGFVVEMQNINSVLLNMLNEKNIITKAKLINLNNTDGLATIITDDGEVKIKAGLIIAADGTDSTARKLCNLTAESKDYNQHALVANIGLARAHKQYAYERFTSTGPLALLPMTGLRSSLVWSLEPKEAEMYSSCSEEFFLKSLQRAFGYRLGRLVKVGQRMVYPLRQVIMKETVIGKVVFIGNAAHTLHPVAGQGFNLGLRDVATLAQCIVKDGISSKMLETYKLARCQDQNAILKFTDFLAEIFTNNAPGLSLMRGLGLVALDNSEILKKILARYARGFGGVIPDLACGLPLISL